MGDRERQAAIIIIAFLATRATHYQEPHAAWTLAHTRKPCLPPRNGELGAADWSDTRSAKNESEETQDSAGRRLCKWLSSSLDQDKAKLVLARLDRRC